MSRATKPPVHLPIETKFGCEEADAAYDEWGCNCGPAAIAAICGLTLDQLRPHFGDFEEKRYTNPTLMWQILNRVAPGSWSHVYPPDIWPRWGLVRIQWGGPWMAFGVPARAQYRHTHWVGSCAVPGDVGIFDVNALHVGGWVSIFDWSSQVVPWLLGQTEPKADGTWFRTHVVEIEP